ncbi:hypothetical protein E0Z10_g7437 [Xylaria hypoxylon]|uniref:Uncharacterized protein n=1 Tax=Xylaria hypoxylon TaxID=37992 RepID=A0A4Z0YPH0_9PEZI|nr:hypothetical protein E0Z10_g7437 [Xylaria hypoxylon]
MVPAWLLLVEEKLPVLCPPFPPLAKALAEGVIDQPGYDTRAEPFFNTEISILAVHIRWKKKFWHKPVFRRTVESVKGPKKSDELLTVNAFDNILGKLEKAAGLPNRPQLYIYRQGNLLQWYKRTIASLSKTKERDTDIIADAGLGRGTKSPYLDILNHIGLQYDKNAPTGVSNAVMSAVGLDSTVRCDLDEDLLEDEIVHPKVDTINARVYYAWKIELKGTTLPQNNTKENIEAQALSTGLEEEVLTPRVMLELPACERAIAPRLRYISMI